MREVIFIKNNEKRWKRIDAYLQGRVHISTDELASFYITLTDDLSYCRTFYPKSNLVDYLNKLAVGVHRKIYKNKKDKRSRIKTFWIYEVPQAVRQGHKELLVSLIIFLVSIGIGIFSSLQDDSYVRLILGDEYVNMTMENIDKKDPMAVYKSASETSMFIGISSNNVRVSLLAYAAGILASVFTGFILFQNGVMVGAFQWFFVKEGLGWISFSTIFIHGALELCAIVIAGGAGIMLGNSWMFPGTYSRRDSLVMGARRSVKIIIGLVPIFIIAALLESFVTRYYQSLGDITRALIIIISFIFIYWYFIYYPIQLEKDGKI